jgi:transcriptional regulator with XRE-family HTH domain
MVALQELVSSTGKDSLMDPKAFGARLKELREASGLSQKALADKAGLSQRGIANWELGLREPLWSNVVALAEALGVDLAAFLQEPKSIPEPKRGRPRKGQGEPPAEGKGKKKPKGKS